MTPCSPRYRIWCEDRLSMLSEVLENDNLDKLLESFIMHADKGFLTEGDVIFDKVTGKSLFRYESGCVIDLRTGTPRYRDSDLKLNTFLKLSYPSTKIKVIGDFDSEIKPSEYRKCRNFKVTALRVKENSDILIVYVSSEDLLYDPITGTYKKDDFCEE